MFFMFELTKAVNVSGGADTAAANLGRPAFSMSFQKTRRIGIHDVASLHGKAELK